MNQYIPVWSSYAPDRLSDWATEEADPISRTRSFADQGTRLRLGILLYLALPFAPALASDEVELPAMHEMLPNPRACLARLHAAEAAGRAAALALTAYADGTSREVKVEAKTKGVERVGQRRARYAARLWYRHGRPRPDLGQIEYSHSWEEQSLECRGRELVTKSSRGHTLSTFEDAE
ncbi:MAG: hypothetical protein MT490_15725 [Sphingomonas sp.]|uniref:hypothetical protein n=1 Tax=Sphingomonas sp. TaxID=28214 RepID=UPI00227498AD|nr:hypothetical protein [Sphingomonas sp.]MCX8477237.1 hypothetical protein [Sphingomonas sp.]